MIPVLFRFCNKQSSLIKTRETVHNAQPPLAAAGTLLASTVHVAVKEASLAEKNWIETRTPRFKMLRLIVRF